MSLSLSTLVMTQLVLSNALDHPDDPRGPAGPLGVDGARGRP